jgi:membrane fusion protein (multidrug efflux system)
MSFVAYAQPSLTGKGRPTAVVIAPVVTQPFTDIVEGLGTLRANESVTLTATVTKTITVVNFTDGQRVKAGEVLVEMNRRQEKAQLAQERALLTEAQRQLARIETLAKEGAASTALLDQREREYRTAQARLAEIQSRLQEYLIIAPFSGVLGLRNVSAGALVRPGDVVATLDDDRLMKLDFTVPSLYLTTMQLGLPIEATAREFPERAFAGKVESIDSRIDPVTRSFIVRAIIPNPDHSLRPGLLMSVRIPANPRDALVVPENSLIPEGRKNFVFTLDPSQPEPRVQRTEVIIGSRKPGWVEILSGLSEGQFVVTHGTLRVTDNTPVLILATQQGGEPLQDILKQPAPDTGKRGNQP